MVIQRLANAVVGQFRPDQDVLNEAIVQAHDRARAGYELYRKYWDGAHPVYLTERLKQFLASNGFSGPDAVFRDNLCSVVIDSLSDRLKLASFTVPGEAAPTGQDGKAADLGPMSQFAADTWQANRGEMLSARAHDLAIALGDSFVCVEWNADEERAAMYANDPAAVRLWYDAEDPDRVLSGSKMWIVPANPMAAAEGTTNADDSVRLNIYYPNRIERYIRNNTIGGGTWRQHTDDEHPEWPIHWTMDGTEGGEPIGIPIVHLANNERGGKYGRSELADVVPLQDALNKAVVDAVRVMDAQGWPQRYATGITEPPADDLIGAPGAFFFTANPQGNFGTLESADAKGLLDLWNKLEEAVATVTRTPQHLFRVTGDFPSGEALKTAEAGLVSKASKRTIVFGEAWEDAMAIAYRLALANGKVSGELPVTGYQVEWEPLETRDPELQHIQAINAKEGISQHQRWREYGYTEEEIERMEDELKAEPDPLDAAMAAFDAGAGPSGRRPGGGAPPPA